MKNVIISNEVKPCIMCKQPTQKIDMHSEGRICSEECQKEFDAIVAEGEKRLSR